MDIQLNYIERGEGFPLILIHGNGESNNYFKRQMEPFSERFRVIAVDTRGHGQSPRGDKPFTLAQFAEDLKDFLDEKGIEQADILGFSDGGNIAILFALKNRHRVRRLILNGANLRPSGAKLSFHIPTCAEYVKSSLMAPFDKKAAAKKEMLGLMVTQPNIRPGELAALTMPVLVIAGSDDMIKDSHTRLIASSIPGARLCVLEGDHFIARRRSVQFNEKALGFLTED